LILGVIGIVYIALALFAAIQSGDLTF